MNTICETEFHISCSHCGQIMITKIKPIDKTKLSCPNCGTYAIFESNTILVRKIVYEKITILTRKNYGVVLP